MAAIERPLVEVLHTIFGNVEDIVRSEVSLAKAEVREEISRSTRAAGWLATGALTAFFATGFFLVGVFFALRSSFPEWAAALMIAGGLGIITAITFQVRAAKIRAAGQRWHSKETLPWVPPQTK
jgi:hypothetical protein